MIRLLMQKKVILTILTGIMIMFGFRLFTTNYTPLKCTLAEYEKSNAKPDAHDFYVFTGSRTTGDAYYVKNAISGTINQFVYPVVSKQMIEDATMKYIATHSDDSSYDNMADWLVKNIKPKVFILSKLEKIGKNEMIKHINDVDSAVINGERVRQLDNINDKIKDELKKDGYEEGSYLLITEDATIDKSPDGNKGAGAIMMALGVFFLWRIFKKKKETPPPGNPGNNNNRGGNNNNNAGNTPSPSNSPTEHYAFVSADPNKGISMEEAQKLRTEFLAVITTDDKQKEYNMAAGMMMSQAYDNCIEAFKMLATKYPEDKGKCLGQIGAAWFFKGDYNKAIDIYVEARQNGANSDAMDDNIWEACEVLYQQSKDKTQIDRYRQLCPNGRHSAEADQLAK